MKVISISIDEKEVFLEISTRKLKVLKEIFDYVASSKKLVGESPETIDYQIGKGSIILKVWTWTYESLGLTLTDVNHIYPILQDAKEILNNGCEVLLLPYCAKSLECEYRKKEGCGKCGKCSVGIAYEMAEKIGLSVTTIQNFEHLMTTLRTLKEKGVKGFIGCCCEAFICKHQQDFESAGIPGILVDIDDQTCYDLGKEIDALNGNFLNQTRIKLDILQKLMNKIQELKQRCHP